MKQGLEIIGWIADLKHHLASNPPNASVVHASEASLSPRVGPWHLWWRIASVAPFHSSPCSIAFSFQKQ